MNRQKLGGLLCACAFGLAGIPTAHGQDAPAASPPPRQSPQVSASRLANAEEIRKQLGLTPAYDNLPGVENIKVAVLDYGFDGVNGPRRYLPEGTVVVEHYDPEFVRRNNLGDPDYRKPFAPMNAHGRTMAQIIWAVTGFHPQGPKFYLLNANGPTMLHRAVRYAIENKIDIILFSNTFEGGGNGDGRGPINRVVADALAADIIWINAAGNYGGHVYTGTVDILPNGFLRLGDQGNEADQSTLRFRNLLDENTVTITLTWNDYREKEDAGTTKDLDLYVQDHLGNVIGSSQKKQVLSGKNEAEESRNPRERIVLTDLPADADHDYFLRIKASGGQFTADDRVRVLITSSREGFFDPKTGAPTEAIRFLDASRKGEIYPPADNPLVLTVGDMSPDSAVGPTADHRRKPDILLEDSRASFTNGDITFGASNAAAYYAGVVVLLKAAEPGLATRHLLWFAHNDKTTRVAAAETYGADSNPTPAPSTSPETRQATSNSNAARRGTLARRLANLAASAPNTNGSTPSTNPTRPRGLEPRELGPLQIRAPYFELYLDRRRAINPSPSGVEGGVNGTARPTQSYYAPLRIRAANYEFNLPPRSSITGREARAPSPSPLGGKGKGEGDSKTQGTNSRQPELVHPPRKANETPPEAQSHIWRTPSREHLADVVQGKGMSE